MGSAEVDPEAGAVFETGAGAVPLAIVVVATVVVEGADVIPDDVVVGVAVVVVVVAVVGVIAGVDGFFTSAINPFVAFAAVEATVARVVVEGLVVIVIGVVGIGAAVGIVLAVVSTPSLSSNDAITFLPF